MTREEQIGKEIFERYGLAANSHDAGIIEGFINGVEWADKNPDMTAKDKFNEAVDRAFESLAKLSKEEFAAKMKECAPTGIGRAMVESNDLSCSCRELEAAETREAKLAKALESAMTMHEELSVHLSKAEYTIDELKQPFDICEPMRNGLMASYRYEFTEALVAWRKSKGE